MKSIKISNDVHAELKKQAKKRGITLDALLRNLVVEKVELAGGKMVELDGGNPLQASNSTNSALQVEKGEKYVTKEEFEKVLEHICSWSHVLLDSLKEKGVNLYD